ncbi:hypothetical protein [Actinocorallia longicatena]|uniref:Uncharacterized protein n=1 Tax=Actinocorallia longicatena TaxID=111803 RepID=A0ABP6QJZ4_9ACTN
MNGRRLVLLASRSEAESRLSALDPRLCDHAVFELAEPHPLTLTPTQHLLAQTAAAPVLLSVLESTAASDVLRTAAYLRDAFPPTTPFPPLPPALLGPVHDLSQGLPGTPVAHGLFPSRVTKLARLLLSRHALHPAAAVLAAALSAYAPSRPYHAHDALACALVHPGIPPAAFLPGLPTRRGHRSRRKTTRLLTWAHAHGHLQR